jgi:hypothetical protein
MIKVFENFIDNDISKKIYNIFTNGFPWYYFDSTNDNYEINLLKNKELKLNIIKNSQFSHTFFVHNKIVSDYFEKIFLLLKDKYFLEIDYIKRIKSNLNTLIPGYTKNNIQIPHIDYGHNWTENPNLIYSLIYYVNDSDGDTIFYDNNEKEIFRVTPKRGKAVLFKSNILHTACNPVNTDKRIIINFIFKTKKEL